MKMMEPNDNDLHLNDNDDHDQLPTVESYKASSGYSSSTPKPKPKLDPTGLHGQFDVYTDVETQGSHHDQLPTVEEYKTGQKTQPKSRFWRNTCCAFLVIVPIVLILALTIPLASNTGGAPNWSLVNSERYVAAEQYLIRAGISSEANLKNESSPQHLAAKWLANKDGMRLPMPNYMNAKAPTSFVERYVLAVLYFATGGPNWTYQLNFLSGNHVCTWYAPFIVDAPDAELEGRYSTLGINGCKLIDDELVPFAIYIPSNNLIGTLPDEIEFLDRMEIFNLQFNSGLVGTLPKALSRMNSLRHISLQWCNFTGTIPTWIGQLTGLKYLGLGNNALTGEIPLQLGNLKELELLGLDDNGLSGNIEFFQAFTNIKSFYLEDNLFTGTISDALMLSWPNLQELDVSHNLLKGSLPDDFFNHGNDLRVIDLSKNDFEGTMPVPAWDNSDLQFLSLADNNFVGSIPSEISRLRALTLVDLSKNEFTSLPESLGTMTQLESLFVGTNAFEAGPMPPYLLSLTNLRELSLKSSRLDGKIPEVIFKLSKLEFLDFHNNNLEGTIPTELGELTGLKHLLLKMNELTGSVPTEFGRFTRLVVLMLDQNYVIGTTDPVCPNKPTFLVTDCNVVCSCCTFCCNEEDVTCNAGDWDASIDSVWEYGFRRARYSYNVGGGIETDFSKPGESPGW